MQTIRAPFLIVATLLIVVVISCEPAEILPDDEKPLVEIDSLLMSYEQDAVFIVINAVGEWSVSCPDNWIQFTSKSGKGKTGIVVGVDENKKFMRMSEIEIKSGSETKNIKIRQNGAPIVVVDVNNNVQIKLIRVAGGKFIIGDNNNRPAHQVQLSDFYITETEITNAQWAAVTNVLPAGGFAANEEPDMPATNIGFNQITANFLPSLLQKTQIKFRLPTEAEWEYAALGGKNSKGYAFAGSNNLDEVGWYKDNSAGKKLKVKLKSPNELGLYDMSGNAAEWCSNWYAEYYIWAELSVNPTGPASGTKRVVRGGDFTSDYGFFGYYYCAIKNRAMSANYSDPDPVVGFRCVVSF